LHKRVAGAAKGGINGYRNVATDRRWYGGAVRVECHLHIAGWAAGQRRFEGVTGDREAEL
jgi:hypothetical protein